MLVSRAQATQSVGLVQYMTNVVGSSQPRVTRYATHCSQLAWSDPRGTTLLLSGTISSTISWWYTLPHLATKESQNTELLDSEEWLPLYSGL